MNKAPKFSWVLYLGFKVEWTYNIDPSPHIL